MPVRQGQTLRLRVAHGGWYWALAMGVGARAHARRGGRRARAADARAARRGGAGRTYDALVTADQPCGNYTMEWHTFDENAGATETHDGFTAVLEYTDCTWWRGDGARARREGAAAAAAAAATLPYDAPPKPALDARTWLSQRAIADGTFRAAPTVARPPRGQPTARSRCASRARTRPRPRRRGRSTATCLKRRRAPLSRSA